MSARGARRSRWAGPPRSCLLVRFARGRIVRCRTNAITGTPGATRRPS
ncbi:Hypothetical protein A7982_11948 [Minicystis rosea]|nr:Hypothetical protein A7982_11948 [Minicystis rosea]